MAKTETRRIGLSLGADLCWPAAYEAILGKLDLSLPISRARVGFEVERVQVEPFDLRYKPRYDLVIDRLTHWFPMSREWIKKIALMDDVYVFNNPWSIQAIEKHTSYCAMMRLGLPIPETWLVPPKAYPAKGEDLNNRDIETVVRRYNRLFDLGEVGQQVGYPAFLKPYDGGGWVGVKRVTERESLHAAYDESGLRLNHLQAGVKDWDLFVRAIGIGPQVNVMKYDPDRPIHDRYQVAFHFLDTDEWTRASRITRVINAFFGWDFNSCEMLRSDGVLHPIDYANACPDSQVTSLHFHFPWVVKGILRWSLFCAATRRKPTLNLDWRPYFKIADDDKLDLDAKLERYEALALKHFDAKRFAAFDKKHLGDLDRVAFDYFGTRAFREVVRAKVVDVGYPPHEVKRFTDHFFGLVQFWRKTEADRLGFDLTTDV